MKCQGKFKFKSLTKKEGGEFTNSQGQQIRYSDSYSLKVDEQTETGIYERVFKISIDSDIIETLLVTKPYTDIVLEFDVVFWGAFVRVVPVRIVK